MTTTQNIVCYDLKSIDENTILELNPKQLTNEDIYITKLVDRFIQSETDWNHYRLSSKAVIE